MTKDRTRLDYRRERLREGKIHPGSRRGKWEEGPGFRQSLLWAALGAPAYLRDWVFDNLHRLPLPRRPRKRRPGRLT